MAVITPATTYPNGVALDIAGHNANVFSTAAGEGILSEPNGGLDMTNLDAAFTVRDEHVMSEEAVMGRTESLTIPMDIYNNAFGMREEDDKQFVAIGGLCQRVYIPFDVSALVWQWSFFVAPFRPFTSKQVEDQLIGFDIPNMSVRMFLDGTEFSAFRRPLTVSGDIKLSPTVLAGTAQFNINYENVTALWYDITKLQQNVTKGYHEIAVKIYIPRFHFDNEEDEAQVRPTTVRFSPSGDTTEFQATLHTRATFGNRSVRCVMFK